MTQDLRDSDTHLGLKQNISRGDNIFGSTSPIGFSHRKIGMLDARRGREGERDRWITTELQQRCLKSAVVICKFI